MFRYYINRLITVIEISRLYKFLTVLRVVIQITNNRLQVTIFIFIYTIAIFYLYFARCTVTLIHLSQLKRRLGL